MRKEEMRMMTRRATTKTQWRMVIKKILKMNNTIACLNASPNACYNAASSNASRSMHVCEALDL